jgi:hypothetical protein
MAKKAKAPALKIMTHPPSTAYDGGWKQTFARECTCKITHDRGDGRCVYCAGKLPCINPLKISST